MDMDTASAEICRAGLSGLAHKQNIPHVMRVNECRLSYDEIVGEDKKRVQLSFNDNPLFVMMVALYS